MDENLELPPLPAEKQLMKKWLRGITIYYAPEWEALSEKVILESEEHVVEEVVPKKFTDPNRIIEPQILYDLMSKRSSGYATFYPFKRGQRYLLDLKQERQWYVRSWKQKSMMWAIDEVDAWQEDMDEDGEEFVPEKPMLLIKFMIRVNQKCHCEMRYFHGAN